MMGTLRKYHGDTFKLKVALEAIKGDKSAVEMVQKFGVTANQVYAWKKHLEDNGAIVFSDKRLAENKEQEVNELYAIIGRLTMERDRLAQVVGRLK
jgi:transposase-like protein